MKIYKIVLKAEGNSNDDFEHYRFKAACKEGALFCAMIRWLRIESRYYEEGVLGTPSFTKELLLTLMQDCEIEDTYNQFDFEAVAERIMNGELSFTYSEFDVELESLEVENDLHDIILGEVHAVLKQEPALAHAELDRDGIFIEGRVLSLSLQIKKAKLIIKAVGDSDPVIGKIDIANPKFPSNIVKAISGALNNIIRTDPILSMGNIHDNSQKPD